MHPFPDPEFVSIFKGSSLWKRVVGMLQILNRRDRHYDADANRNRKQIWAFHQTHNHASKDEQKCKIQLRDKPPRIACHSEVKIVKTQNINTQEESGTGRKDTPFALRSTVRPTPSNAAEHDDRHQNNDSRPGVAWLSDPLKIYGRYLQVGGREPGCTQGVCQQTDASGAPPDLGLTPSDPDSPHGNRKQDRERSRAVEINRYCERAEYARRRQRRSPAVPERQETGRQSRGQHSQGGNVGTLAVLHQDMQPLRHAIHTVMPNQSKQ